MCVRFESERGSDIEMGHTQTIRGTAIVAYINIHFPFTPFMALNLTIPVPCIMDGLGTGNRRHKQFGLGVPKAMLN